MTNLVNIDISVKTGKGYQKFLNKLKKFEQLVISAGIYGVNSRRRKIDSNGKRSKISVGRLAMMHEKGYSYTLKKTIRFEHPKKPDQWICMPAGKVIIFPPRPAFAGTLIKYKANINKIAKMAINASLVGGKTPSWAMKVIGSKVRDTIKKSYTDGKYIFNKKLTQELKGHSTPLVGNEGTFVDAIDYKINKSGSVSNKLNNALSMAMSDKLRRIK